ncbi:sulfurtransferase [Alteromonas sp. CYL-A6]|uniref:sulfurtransferase n=1 Tax=Alteromonas nitratireducens TaxID=3390813 RepID=UPI0034BEF087
MPNPLIDIATLGDRLMTTPVVLLRALMDDPVSGQADARDDAWLPRTVDFDIDGQGSDHAGRYPHTRPSPDALAGYLGNSGISEQTEVIVYDTRGMYCAPRVWWLLKSLGHQNAWLLDGGYPAAAASGLPVNAERTSQPNRQYNPSLGESWFVDADDVLVAMEQGRQIVDARSPERFKGSAQEPRPGVRPGHIPGSKNVYYQDVLTNGRFKSSDAISAVFDAASVDLAEPLIFTCGSGITACIIGVAALIAGANTVAVYDGSWSEWGADKRFPVETGGE